MNEDLSTAEQLYTSYAAEKQSSHYLFVVLLTSLA